MEGKSTVGREKLRRHLAGSSVNLFYVPALILVTVFSVYPLFSGFALSLTNWDGLNPEKTFVGLANYVTMLHDANFRTILVASAAPSSSRSSAWRWPCCSTRRSGDATRCAP